MKRLLSFVLFTACGAHTTPNVATNSASRSFERPNVVVSIVVDQLAGWIAEERLPKLPDTGGFARLRREGAWALDMRYQHAVTDTAPGHAALYTALVPRDNGIYANEIFDAETHRYTSILRDASTHLVGESGVLEAHGSSLHALRTETVADRLRAERPDAYIVSLSLKDRGALFGAGRKPDGVVWYDPRNGGFVTSSAFGVDLPRWAPRAKTLEAAATKPWTISDDAFIRANALTPDDQNGEGDAGDLGRTFPHPAPSSTKLPLVALRYTPAADDVLFDAAIDAIDARTNRSAFVSISFSTHDYVAHVWGPDSWEAWDELRRFDASLGRFLAKLDERVGPNGWALVLSADHGSTSMPEVGVTCKKPDRLGRACGENVTRVVPAALAMELDAAATKALGDGPWIVGIADPYVYFTPKGIAERTKLEPIVRDALSRHSEVARVLPAVRREACEPGESIDALVCRSLTDTTKDALYIALQPGSFFDSGHAIGHGGSHGSPYAFDRSVPFLARGPGVPTGLLLREPISFESYARTLCSMLGVGSVGAAALGRDFTALAR